ncbi:MAG: hypothetical protein RML12_01835 [Xanthomonadales bacterium]|nr:hypothetical protein [Xanthomonadales bacterium]
MTPLASAAALDSPCAIQASGYLPSPRLGHAVQVEGIVTAIIGNGFFAQLGDAERAADPACTRRPLERPLRVPRQRLRQLADRRGRGPGAAARRGHGVPADLGPGPVRAAAAHRDRCERRPAGARQRAAAADGGGALCGHRSGARDRARSPLPLPRHAGEPAGDAGGRAGAGHHRPEQCHGHAHRGVLRLPRRAPAALPRARSRRGRCADRGGPVPLRRQPADLRRQCRSAARRERRPERRHPARSRGGDPDRRAARGAALRLQALHAGARSRGADHGGRERRAAAAGGAVAGLRGVHDRRLQRAQSRGRTAPQQRRDRSPAERADRRRSASASAPPTWSG